MTGQPRLGLGLLALLGVDQRNGLLNEPELVGVEVMVTAPRPDRGVRNRPEPDAPRLPLAAQVLPARQDERRVAVERRAFGVALRACRHELSELLRRRSLLHPVEILQMTGVGLRPREPRSEERRVG